VQSGLVPVLEEPVVPQPYPHGELVVVIDCADPDGNEFCVLQPPA
jgi:hypothetical protein